MQLPLPRLELALLWTKIQQSGNHEPPMEKWAGTLVLPLTIIDAIQYMSREPMPRESQIP
eukprot:scaffold141812_cov63-Attheya_sp.AAC.1